MDDRCDASGLDGCLVSMAALDGWAQFSGWNFILTGDTGECPNREPSGIGTRGSIFSRMLCGEDGLEETGFRRTGLVVAEPLWGGEESTAAIAKGRRVLSLMASASDQCSEPQSYLLVSRDESPGEVA